MKSQLQLRGPFPRHRFSCTSSYKGNLHFSALKLTVCKNYLDGTTVSDSEREGGRLGVRGKAFWCTGLGIFVTGLYYLVINGPSRYAPTSTTKPLSPSHFTPLTLTATTPCTPYTKLLTLTLPRHLIPDEAGRRQVPIFSIYIKDSDIQIERQYTPLDSIDEQGRIRFWVKRYQGGEVGRWLHERKVGDVVEVRGPVQNWEWQDGVWEEIVMISGGTGITPFCQLLNCAFSGEKPPRTRFTLLHSSPTPLDLPPPELLHPLQTFAQAYPGTFSLRLFVDSNEPRNPRHDMPQLYVGRIGRRALDEALLPEAPEKMPRWRGWFRNPIPQPRPGERKILFLVCGPEQMITTIAGSRARSQPEGRVSGVLGDMGIKSGQVWKL